MSLHPDDRPQTVIEFREALLGNQDIPERADLHGSGFNRQYFSILPQERVAGYLVLGLFIIGLLATVAR